MVLDSPPRLEDVSVLIPTLGREILQQALASIADGSAWPASVVVVDQSSSPAVAAWLRRLSERGIPAEHVPSNQRGRARGINRGIERIRTRFFAVTDDDCLVDHDWLANLEAQLKRHPESIVTGRVAAAGDEVMLGVVESTAQRVHRRPRLTFDSLSGGNMGTSLAVVERVGAFDEDPCVATAEDGEWAYRALRAGVSIVYAPEVVVRHVGWRDASDRAAQYRSYAHSHGGFYGKYIARGDAFIALRALLHHLRALRRWLRGVWRGDADLAENGRAYFIGLPRGILAGLRSQRASRSSSRRGP